MSINIIVTNSANIIVGQAGPDTLENLIAHVASWEPCHDSDGNSHPAFVTVMYDGWVWVTIPSDYDDGIRFSSLLVERVGYLVGSDADPDAE